jgi:hypothetical protein
MPTSLSLQHAPKLLVQALVYPQHSAAHLMARYLEHLKLRSQVKAKNSRKFSTRSTRTLKTTHQEDSARIVEKQKRKRENGVAGDIATKSGLETVKPNESIRYVLHAFGMFLARLLTIAQ